MVLDHLSDIAIKRREVVNCESKKMSPLMMWPMVFFLFHKINSQFLCSSSMYKQYRAGMDARILNMHTRHACMMICGNLIMATKPYNIFK